MMRRALQICALVATGLLVGGLLLEAGVRISGRAQGIDHRLYLRQLVHSGRFAAGIWRATEPGPPSTLTERAYRHYPPFKANAQILETTSDYSVVYLTNSKGLRDREYDYEKRHGVIRVLAFGDSFTFGSGVAQKACFTEVAEDALDGVEILNMGVPGYGLDQILLSFLAQGVKYHPDVVLVLLNSQVTNRHRTGIYRGDTVRIPDQLDAVEFTGESGGTAYLRPEDPLWTSDRSWFVRHSYALALLTYRWQLRRLQKQLEAEDERFWGGPARRNAATPLREERAALRQQRTTALLRELSRAVEAVGAHLLVANIDARVATGYLTNVPGLDVVDFAHELDARSNARPLTFTYDTHYNDDTHRFLGERLAEELRRRLSGRQPPG
jgi:hypothetical protein